MNNLPQLSSQTILLSSMIFNQKLNYVNWYNRNSYLSISKFISSLNLSLINWYDCLLYPRLILDYTPFLSAEDDLNEWSINFNKSTKIVASSLITYNKFKIFIHSAFQFLIFDFYDSEYPVRGGFPAMHNLTSWKSLSKLQESFFENIKIRKNTDITDQPDFNFANSESASLAQSVLINSNPFTQYSSIISSNFLNFQENFLNKISFFSDSEWNKNVTFYWLIDLYEDFYKSTELELEVESDTSNHSVDLNLLNEPHVIDLNLTLASSLPTTFYTGDPVLKTLNWLDNNHVMDSCIFVNELNSESQTYADYLIQHFTFILDHIRLFFQCVIKPIIKLNPASDLYNHDTFYLNFNYILQPSSNCSESTFMNIFTLNDEILNWNYEYELSEHELTTLPTFTSPLDLPFTGNDELFLCTENLFNDVTHDEVTTSNIRKSVYSFTEPFEINKFIVNRYSSPQITDLLSNFSNEQDDYTHEKWLYRITDKLLFPRNAHINFIYHSTVIPNESMEEDHDLNIRRIRFKPGYMRIWRTARTVLAHFINFQHKYQYRITRYLSKFKNLIKTPYHLFYEMQLGSTLLYGRFFFTKQLTDDFIKTGNVFVNGLVCTNPRFQLYRLDFVQCVLNIKYYIAYKSLLQYTYMQKLSMKHKLKRKNDLRASNVDPNLMKINSHRLPAWLLFHKYWLSDIPSHLELDYVSMSCFILHEPLYYNYLPNIDIFDIKYNIFNMYNWKYIT